MPNPINTEAINSEFPINTEAINSGFPINTEAINSGCIVNEWGFSVFQLMGGGLNNET